MNNPTQQSKIPLIFALAIPFIMVVLIALSIYVPRLFATPPQYDFLYVINDSEMPYTVIEGKFYYSPIYRVENGKLVQRLTPYPESSPDFPKPVPVYPQTEPKLYFHDVGENKSREMTFAKAQELSLDPSIMSPDGFEVREDYGAEGVFPLFFGSSREYGARYLVGDYYSEKLNLVKSNTDRYYPYNLRFLGWVSQDS